MIEERDERLDVLESAIRAHGVEINKIKSQSMVPVKPSVVSVTERLHSAGAGFVRGRYCITALNTLATLPGVLADWDAEFDKESLFSQRRFAAMPTCYGEIRDSFWAKFTSRLRIIFDSNKPFQTKVYFAVDIPSGKKMAYKFNGASAFVSTNTEVVLNIKSGRNNLAVMSEATVNYFMFAQFLDGVNVKQPDLGCGTMAGDKGTGGGSNGVVDPDL